ncbi:helix-turn-helix domain-containing protein [Rhodococcus wratislaviensis]|uniref:Putative AraC family transcriptional regulator n=1 Tax=Rhodococcus wratislaviensis NBRC 100605 TaxID=1219028 RepID=X0PUH4_RHOWR|nr:helix-turn-helix domain-containing protein [Rhodococcus wratislaviensis]GAF46834.1 putative AraC family transcriptional regulator [Rhodococcus wratislaviensis NBRC 100605]
MYTERRSVFPGAVVWQKTAPAGAAAILPDGCMDLIWMNGDVVVAGPDSRPYLTRSREGDRYVGLRCSPGTLPDLLGTPAEELTNLRVPLAEVLSDRATTEFLGRIADDADPGRALEEFARSQRLLGPPPDSRIPVIVRLLEQQASVREVADLIGVGERQLHRLCRRQFGYGPKMLARILRLQSALGLAGSSIPAAQAAGMAGFADQAHLIREAHELTGRTFGQLVTA